MAGPPFSLNETSTIAPGPPEAAISLLVTCRGVLLARIAGAPPGGNAVNRRHTSQIATPRTAKSRPASHVMRSVRRATAFVVARTPSKRRFEHLPFLREGLRPARRALAPSPHCPVEALDARRPIDGDEAVRGPTVSGSLASTSRCSSSASPYVSSISKLLTSTLRMCERSRDPQRVPYLTRATGLCSPESRHATQRTSRSSPRRASGRTATPY